MLSHGSVFFENIQLVRKNVGMEKIALILIFIKGNLTFQDILNWVLQLLLYHCSKQPKNIENFEHYWTKYCYLSQSFSLFTLSWASIFLNARYFSVLGESTLRKFKRHKWSFVPLHKKCVYNNFLRCFVSSVIESLQIFLK